ncbi:hypothetical protein AHAS_Ahas16G0004500 [Arachis hypogaea]
MVYLHHEGALLLREAAASVAVTVRMKERRVWQGAIGAAVGTEWEVMVRVY